MVGFPENEFLSPLLVLFYGLKREDSMQLGIWTDYYMELSPVDALKRLAGQGWKDLDGVLSLSLTVLEGGMLERIAQGVNDPLRMG